VVRLALQTYGFYYESQTSDAGDLDMLQDSILATVETAEDSESDWEQIFGALQLTHILVQAFPNTLLSSSASPLWVAIRKCLSFPHAWVKESSAKLIGSYFANFARNNAESGLEGLPLQGSQGLKLKHDDITELIRRTANIFKTPGLTAELAQETVKNLVFLGLVAGTNDLSFKASQDVDDSDDNDAEEESKKRSALQYLFGRLSFILRRETSPPRAPGLIPKTAALLLLEKLTAALPSTALLPCFPTLLLPLHNLTDTSIPVPYSTDEIFKTNYEALRSDSETLMETLKRKFGTKDYSEAVLAVRKGVVERRNARSGKRKIDAVSAPERYGEQKRKKGERKRERRKEKGQEHGKRRNEY
jgi:U3 small nucleolar RNA-associated protein 20